MMKSLGGHFYNGTGSLQCPLHCMYHLDFAISSTFIFHFLGFDLMPYTVFVSLESQFSEVVKSGRF